MRNLTRAFRKMCFIVLCLTLGGKAANATTYTAVLSGNFNSGLTWGGSAPGALVSTDIVVIPAGIIVTMTSNESFSGTSSLTVLGTLNALPATALSITSGTLAGIGTISADSMALGLTSGFGFTGSIITNKLTSLGATITTAANVTVSKLLNLASGTLSVGAGILTMGNLSTIEMTGGAIITTGGGILSLDSLYNVTYMLTSTIGTELGGLGIDSIIINTTGTVTLAANTTINGTLSLASGTLALAGYTLTFGPLANLLATGTGTIKGSTLSNVIVNTTGGLTGALRFATGVGDSLNNLVINTTTGVTTLGSNLNINNLLTMTTGALAIGANTLTLNSAANIAAGAGALTGSTLSNLVINTTGGLTNPLTFTTGSNMLNNLTLNTTTGGVTMAADMALSGLLTLTSGTLSLNGNTLTLNPAANIAASGAGTLTGGATSNLIVNTTGSLTGALRFAPLGNLLNNLTVNTGTGSGLTLGSDLGINGILTLTAGTLSLAGHTLTLNTTGNLSAAGIGTITGSTLSNLVVNTTGGLTGALRFATGVGDSLNNLVINTTTGVTTLGSNLNVNNLLTMTTGALAIGANTLTLNPAGNIAASGTGMLTGSALSNLVINTTGGLTNPLTFTTGSNMLNNLTLNTTTGGATMAADMALSGLLTLTSGTLSLNGHTLTLNPTANVAAAAAGTLTGSATSDLVVNTTGSLTGALSFATGGNILNNLVVNTGAGTGMTLGSDLNISGLLTLTAGTLSLAANTLTMSSTGNLSATGAGTFTGSTLSSIVVNATDGLTGALRFATGAGGTLKNLVINTAIGGAALASDLNIDNLLTLAAGTLSLNAHTLILNPNADLSTMSGTLTGSTMSNLVVNSTFSLTSALQFATGGNILNSLTMNMGSGSDDIMLGSNLTIQGALNLVSGKVKLGVNDLDIATGAMVNGGTENSYVITDNAGSLIMNLATGANDTFKVGSLTNFAPIALLANAGAATGNVSVSVTDGVLSNGYTGTSLSAIDPLVNATWFVSSTASTINYNMVAMWSAGMQVNGFNNADAYISHFTAGAWDVQTPSASGMIGDMYSMTRTGITSLSPFMVRSAAALSVPVVTAAGNKVSIYPNPTTSILNYTTTATISNIDISDVTGRVVKSTNGLSQSVSVSELAAGTYFVHFYGNDVNTVLKFVKD